MKNKHCAVVLILSQFIENTQIPNNKKIMGEKNHPVILYTISVFGLK